MKKLLNVEGMSCEHCVRAVKNALTDIGASEVNVDLTAKTVEVVYEDISLEDIKNAIAEEGYTVL